MYGSDAANGVILITTRKATKKSGLGVSYGYNMQFTFLREFPAYQNVYGSASLPAVGVGDGFNYYGSTQRTVMLMTPACLMVFLYLTGRIRTNAHGGCRC
ncbi:hypothetical protein NXY28_26355 [Bacteroides thetaiotaomicron]|nr:hypothetical protein NXY28_26355 [Bacteroides thetaiotaomicron]